MSSGQRNQMQVVDYAAEVALLALRVIGKSDETEGFLQFFDAHPERGGGDTKIEEDKLDRQAARARMAERIEAGFSGVCAFACFEADGPRLQAEAFDSRPDNARKADLARSVSVYVPLRRNWRGKWVSPIEGVAIDLSADELACFDETIWAPAGLKRLNEKRANSQGRPRA